jgi:hypothetical protein
MGESTYVWFIARMCPHMDIKVRLLIETLRAALDRALVPFLATFRACGFILGILVGELE